MIIKRGTQKADEMSLNTFIKATDEGFLFYKAAGFVRINDF